MADTITSAPTTEANMPEKPAPAQVHTARHDQSQMLQPMQFQPLDVPKPEPFQPSKAFSIAKLVLGSTAFLSAILVLGLSLGTFTIAYYDILTVILAGSLAITCIIWQVAEFITLAVRRSIYRTIHPGAHIGMHLVLWVLALLVSFCLCLAVSYKADDWTTVSECADSDYYGGYYEGYDGYYYCGYYYTFASTADAHRYFALLEAAAAFSILELMAHLSLFVMACVETDRRRKHARQTRVVYMVATSGPADGRTYYSPMPAAAVVGGGVPHAPMQQQQQQQQTGPNPEMHGYFALAAPAPTAAAGGAGGAHSSTSHV